jgi:hypothetical protein
MPIHCVRDDWEPHTDADDSALLRLSTRTSLPSHNPHSFLAILNSVDPRGPRRRATPHRLAFLDVGIGLRHSSLGDYAAPLGVLACGSMLLVIWRSELLERLCPRGVRAFDFKGVKRFHPDDMLFLLAPFTWLGWLVPILVASSVCTPIFAIVITVRYFSLKRRISVA